MSKVDLTDKERAILWAICSWFQNGTASNGRKALVTGSLMSKLYTKDNNEIAKKYDEKIENRIISLGEWLVQKRTEKEAQ